MAEGVPHWLGALARGSGFPGEPQLLAGGRNNQGVLLHRLPPGPAGRPTLLIEKRSRDPGEARLQRRLQRWQRRHPEVALLPRVYGVLPAGETRGDGWRLFQAYVPHPVAEPAEPQQAGRWLAELAHGFHTTMARLKRSQRVRPASLLQRQARRLVVVAAAGGAAPAGLEAQAVAELAASLTIRLAEVPPVFAHNDLHWTNIRSTAAGPEGCRQLIDLGRAGWNLPGAEFHWALRQSLLGGSGSPVWIHAIEHYAALSGGDPRVLRLSCLWYALLQAAGVRRQLAVRVPPGPWRREDRLILRLLARINAALESGQASPPPAR